MKRKILRWCLLLAGLALCLIAIVFLSLDYIAKSIAEKRIANETGFPAKIGKLQIGLRTPTIHLQNLVLKNPPEFGGDIFLNMPELFVEYDRDALRAGKLHLNLVRLNLDKIHIVENRDGKKNIDALQKRQREFEPRIPSTTSTNQPANSRVPNIVFDGVDRLDVTLNSVEFSSEKHSDQNLNLRLGIQHEIFNNLKTELDFQTAEAVLILKAGLSGGLNFDLFWKGAAKQLKKDSKPAEPNDSTNRNSL